MDSQPDTMPFDTLVEFYKSESGVHDVFGVILFTTLHPYVVKVLRDEDLWAALNKITGQRWIVFAVRSGASAESQKSSPALVKKALAYFTAKIFSLKFLGVIQPIPAWTSPDDNLKLLAKFGIADEGKLPMLLIFTELPSGQVLQTQWPFSADNKDDAFKSLKTVLEQCAESISQIRSEYIKNDEAVFELMKTAKINYSVATGIKKGFFIVQWLKSLFS